ncbi:site-specific integrase [Bradyrhizobium barranii subsp. barranii]|uniref:Site-specific integrase n=2 Tax=Bradyrhizobium barranii subsp. barranii TaxID=2823807 RepID=A0A9X9YRG0_9BRAD|nr:tyrosine-type recombinase/integrase [Bradyrhizobium barranii]UGX93515.1 site-specific integrase [Bradyrhizobium barranii subsp. barranii]
MLVRVVRPMRRDGSRFPLFVQRIPADVRSKAVGLELAIPLGDGFVFVTPSDGAQAVRFSLRTAEPSEIKTRQALAAAHLETVWAALRNDAPAHLTHRQATALAGELYRVWADSESRARSVAMVHTPGVGWAPDTESHEEQEAHWAAVAEMWEKVGHDSEAKKLEKTLGPIVDRLLLTKGIRRVDSESRSLLLTAFWMALRDAFASRHRNAGGDYSLDPKAARFPEWQAPADASKEKPKRGASKNSLSGLVEDWWKEAKRAGRKQSTYESYRNSMARLVTFLKHDTASRVTPEDIVCFKDYRVQSGVSPKTVKDSDLAGMKTVFGWAIGNRRLASNPAEGITIKVGKPRKLRSKGFYDSEAIAILKHAREFVPGREAPKLAAAKRWVPWLCAFTGGRVGEMIQIRKEDLRREGKLWVLHVTPEAGPVKTDEARDVVLHRQVIEEGFLAFFEKSKGGYLFIDPKAGELGVRNAVKTARNKVNEFVREVVKDKNVDPSHGWRHRFKTVGIDQGVEMRVLDAIQGHAPRNVSEGYGDVTIKAKANAIVRFPSIT